MRQSLLHPFVRGRLPLLLFIVVLFVVGVVFGILLGDALTASQQSQLAGELHQYAALLQSDDLNGGTLLERAWFHGRWVLLAAVLGMSVIGVPFILALDFLKGVMVGFAVGTLASQYSWTGILMSLAAIAPHNMVLLPALLIASTAAISFAVMIVKSLLKGRQASLAPALAAYASIMGALLILCMLAALIEAYLSINALRWVLGLLDGSGTVF